MNGSHFDIILLPNSQFSSTSVLSYKSTQKILNNLRVGFSIQFKGDRLIE